MNFNKIKTYVLAHKMISAVVALIILFVGYRVYASVTGSGNATTRYVLAEVTKGTITTAVSGSGQVSAKTSVEVLPKASGDVTGVNVKNGDTVARGQLLATLDARSAAVDLQNAQTSLEKLQEPVDASTLLQAQNAVTNAQKTLDTDTKNLTTVYTDAYTTITNTFVTLPSIFDYLDPLVNSGSNYLSDINVRVYGNGAWTFKSQINADYLGAHSAFANDLTAYHALSYDAPQEKIDAFIKELTNTSGLVATLVKDTNTLLQYIQDNATVVPANLASDKTALGSYNDKINTALSNLTGAATTIQKAHDAIEADTRALAEKKESLAKVTEGADPLDVRTQQSVIDQKRLAYDNYFIRAPIAGVVSGFSLVVGNHVSGSAIATIFTKSQIANITLNEVDAAKVRVGQPVTLTFDAIDGLSISGQVIEVDPVGTVSQGVVTYNIQIGFDTQDDRVKPGMSVSADIITDVKQDVLIVPNSAVKTQGSASYVEVLGQQYPQSQLSAGVTSATPPSSKTVEVGLSNDTNTEILSGLAEGDQVVASTIAGSATAKSASQTPSLLQSIGGSRGGGGTRSGAATGGFGGVRN